MDLFTIALAILFLFTQRNAQYFHIYLIILICVLMINVYNVGNINEFFVATSNEAAQGVASLYNSGNLTVTNLKVTGTLDTTAGAISANTINASGLVTTNNGLTTTGITSTGTITVDKRTSDWGPNIQMFAPKKESAYLQWMKNDGTSRTCYDMGTYRAHEGNGNFQIDLGSGNFVVNSATMKKGDNRLLYENLPMGIQSSRTGYLSDQGGWKGVPTDSGKWETMYLRIPSFATY